MQAIQDALDRHGGNKPKAAEELGISLKTLYNKLNQAAALEIGVRRKPYRWEQGQALSYSGSSVCLYMLRSLGMWYD